MGVEGLRVTYHYSGSRVPSKLERGGVLTSVHFSMQKWLQMRIGER